MVVVVFSMDPNNITLETLLARCITKVDEKEYGMVICIQRLGYLGLIPRNTSIGLTMCALRYNSGSIDNSVALPSDVYTVCPLRCSCIILLLLLRL